MNVGIYHKTSSEAQLGESSDTAPYAAVERENDTY